MAKKILTLSLLAFFVLALAMPLLPRAYAVHSPNVNWMFPTVPNGKQATSMIVSGINFPSWFNFTVQSNPISGGTPNNIVKIELVIPRNATTNLVYFDFVKSAQPNGWTSTPSEFDANGWPGLITFANSTSMGITPSTPLQNCVFQVEFSAGPSVCNYDFKVYTVDTTTQTELSDLYLTIDNTPPEITTLVPNNNSNITANWNPYPLAHYLVIQVAADDHRPGAKHDTGIWQIQISIDNVLKYTLHSSDFPVNFPTVPITLNYYGLSEGSHTITAVAWDGANNTVSQTNTFMYHIPRLFFASPTQGTVGPLTTYNSIKGVYVGSITTFGGIQFGTNVTVTGLPPAPPLSKGFTPNSFVDIFVYSPLWGKIPVLRNVPTGSKGQFQAWFLFPTGPYGIYKIEADDLGGVVDTAYFNVIPQIAYNPPIVIGPATVEALGTGLPGSASITSFMINGTDALSTIDHHVVNWQTHDNGTLYTNIADEPGLLMPVLQNGLYNLKLAVQGQKWNGFASVDGGSGSYSTVTYEVQNTVQVANDFQSLLNAMKSVTDGFKILQPTIASINGTVVSINTEVGKIEAKLDDLKPTVLSIQNDLIKLNTTIGQIWGKVSPINWNDILTMKTAVLQINMTVGQIAAKVVGVDFSHLNDLGTILVNTNVLPTIKLSTDQISAIKSNTDKLYSAPEKTGTIDSISSAVTSTPLSIGITAVLAAIAAIAAVATAMVVTRRLKVAQ